VRALYFVRRWPSLGAKLGIPDEFSPNCFPITPHRNGNIGNFYRDLLESGFKVGRKFADAKISPGEIFTKNKKKRMCCWITLFISCKNNFSKI
jgi:hypothetical protein